ncbi:MAG: excinuclease ABC subunit UvrC [Spirochaetia bacterium]
MENPSASEHGSSHPYLRETAKHFPTDPGVYLMRNADNEILYIGKAKNLRNRVRSYFIKDRDTKTSVLMSKVTSVENLVCRNEYEALLLENNLIKEWKPRYNINLKDGKSYPVIRITNEEYPRVFRTRNIVQDGSKYFGPYASVHQLDRYLELIERLFPVRKCRGPIRKRDHPCLYYHIGRCAAVCAGKTDRKKYLRRIRGIERLLNGEVDNLIADQERMMKTAVAELKFEHAATFRDTIAAIRNVNKEQQVVDFELDNRDYLGFFIRNEILSLTLFHMRSGNLVGSENYQSEVVGEESEYLSQFLIQYYGPPRAVPEKLIIGSAKSVVEAIAPSLETFFSSELDRSVSITVPASTRDASVVRMAAENARQDYQKSVHDHGNTAALEELQSILGLPALPRRIEGFDIAQVSGKHPVASMVSFADGRPDKARYRKFHVKTLGGRIDDFAAVREVVARRYTRLVNENKPLPDLILIDGGKGQLSSALSVLRALEITTPVLGLAKRDEEIFLPGRSDPIRLPEGSEPLRILQFVRDEAHRFATMFRADLQTKDFALNTLQSIPGIGRTRSRKLLERFGSLAALAEADTTIIAAETHISLQKADDVKTAVESARVAQEAVAAKRLRPRRR